MKRAFSSPASTLFPKFVTRVPHPPDTNFANKRVLAL